MEHMSDLRQKASLEKRKEKILKPGKHIKGYPQVFLYKGGHGRLVCIHRLVAEAFIPNPNNLEAVNHKDEVKTNNSVANLEWITIADNTRYSANKAIQMLDKNTGELLATFPSIKEANSSTGINRGNIGECCLGHRKSAGGYFWRYL